MANKNKKNTKTKSKTRKSVSKSKSRKKNPILSNSNERKFEKLRERALSFGSYVYKYPKDYSIALKRSKPAFNYFFIDFQGRESPVFHDLEELETALNIEEKVSKQIKKWDW